jgi:type III secretion system YscI/HrpB-like protein
MTDGMIVEAIRSVQLSQVDHAQMQGSAQAVDNPKAVEHFQAAMNSGEVTAPTRAESIPFANEASAAWRNAQEEHQGILHRIHALTEMNLKEGVNAAAFLEMQYEVMNLSFQQEVVAKVADKSSNAVQTLIKNQ